MIIRNERSNTLKAAIGLEKRYLHTNPLSIKNGRNYCISHLRMLFNSLRWFWEIKIGNHLLPEGGTEQTSTAPASSGCEFLPTSKQVSMTHDKHNFCSKRNSLEQWSLRKFWSCISSRLSHIEKASNLSFNSQWYMFLNVHSFHLRGISEKRLPTQSQLNFTLQIPVNRKYTGCLETEFTET